MALTQEDRSLLGRIGFFLCHNGRIPEAEDIFAGLRDSAPEKDGAVAGMALCRVIRGDSEGAIGMLDERLERGSPIAEALSLYKLLALGVAGRISDAKALRESMSGAGMEKAILSADTLLQDMEAKFAK